MSPPLYPAAHTYAARLEEHFARLAAGQPGAVQAAPLPDAAAIEALIDAGFWASLQREEGFAPEISLAFLPPAGALRPLVFASPLPLGPRVLARLAPAVRRPGIHLGVTRANGGALQLWGTTRAIPSFCFVLEVLGPGLLVVKHRICEGSAKFRNVAVFEGEQVKLLRRGAVDASDQPELVRQLLATETSGAPDDPVEVLLRLAVAMRAHRRGGTLLVVPAGDEAWRTSIERPLSYAVEPPFTELADVMHEPAAAAGDAPDALGRVTDAVAGLTAVDGATLINDRFELLAFGVKIGRPDGRSRVERVLVSEPVEGGAASVVPSIQLGGTRHFSAAQFVQDQHHAFALVASQDGRFTIFAWSPREGLVHAHRVEVLLQ